MRNKIFVYVSIIFAILFVGCSGKTPEPKVYGEIELEQTKEDIIVYINNDKDIEKLNMFYIDLKKLIAQEKIPIKYNCELITKEKKKFVKVNNSYTEFTGVLSTEDLDSCDKNENILYFDNSLIATEGTKIIFSNIASNEEKINLYMNFLDYLYTQKIDETNTLITKYNILPIPFSLDTTSFTSNNLVLNDEYLQLVSIKSELENYLSKNDYKITQNKNEATIVIDIENLAFGNNYSVNKELQKYVEMESRKTSGASGLVSPSTGNAILDGIGILINVVQIAITASNVVKDITKPEDYLLYSIHKAYIYENDISQEKYLASYVSRKYKTNVISISGVSVVNKNIASYFAKHRLKEK